MAVASRENEEQVLIPRALVERMGALGLTASEFLLVVTVLSFSAGGTGPVLVSSSQVAKRMAVTQRCVQLLRSKLVRRGFIRVVPLPWHGRGAGSWNLAGLWRALQECPLQHEGT